MRMKEEGDSSCERIEWKGEDISPDGDQRKIIEMIIDVFLLSLICLLKVYSKKFFVKVKKVMDLTLIIVFISIIKEKHSMELNLKILFKEKKNILLISVELK